jgi:hypothetical protein
MDVGLHFFKKYLSMITADYFDQYTNKSQYSAPEVLEAKGCTVEKPTVNADCYSLGMIYWYAPLTQGDSFR